ncbi:unnamed protein product [Dicrocoelium dendriticum]|nr:unnamed protein product [Dicrocoelium dendriticum]
MECIVSYISTLLAEQLATAFPCPSYQCGAHGSITDAELEQILPPAVYKRYLDQLSVQAIRNNPTLTFCPAVDCGAVCKIRVPSETETLLGVERPRTTLNNVVHRLWSRCCYSMRHARVAEPGLSVTVISRDVDKTFSDYVSGNFAGSPTPSPASPPLDHQLLSPKSPPSVRVSCSSCGHVFCSRCHLPWHENGPTWCQPDSQRRRARSSRTLSKRTPSPASHRRGSLDHASTSHRLITRRSERMRTGKRSSGGKLGALSAKMSDSALVDLSVFAVGFPPYPPDAWLKRCPACLVPIERVDGCAQMMCRSCRHTFCWHCLASLDNDFLLHHYDVGACKGKLGHSRASVLGHRVYVVSVLTGLTLLFLVTAPFVVISLPCIFCAKCHYLYRRYRLRQRHSSGHIRPQEVLVSEDCGLKKAAELDSLTAAHDCLVTSSTPDNSADLAATSSGAFVLAETADIHWCSLPTAGTPLEPPTKPDSVSSDLDAT